MLVAARCWLFFIPSNTIREGVRTLLGPKNQPEYSLRMSLEMWTQCIKFGFGFESGFLCLLWASNLCIIYNKLIVTDKPPINHLPIYIIYI